MTVEDPGDRTARQQFPSDQESSLAFTLDHLDLHSAHPVVIRIEYGVDFGPLPRVVVRRWQDEYGLPVPLDLVRDDPRLVALIDAMSDEVIGDWGSGRWEGSWERPVGSVYALVMRPERVHVWVEDYDGREALLASAEPIVQLIGDGPLLLSTPPGEPLAVARIPLLRVEPC